MSSLCGLDCLCENCEDVKICDIYYHEMGYQLLEAQFEEDWRERTT